MERVIDIDKSFDLEKTLKSGQCFHFKKVEDYFIVYGLNNVCKIKQVGNKLYINATDVYYWLSYFALDEDYEDIIAYLKSYARENNDTFSLESIEKGMGIRILRQPFFETCVSFIISQRNNIPRIRKIIFDMSERFSSRKIMLDGVEYKLFPSLDDLQKLSLEELKSVGLGYRAEYIYDFVRVFPDMIDRVRFDYEKDLEVLKSCKGIGDKVANCICLFAFNEYDAFPIDVWINKILEEEYTSKGKEFKKPKKYAGILQQFMFFTRRSE